MDGNNSINAWQEVALLDQEGFLEEAVQSFLQQTLNAEFQQFIQAKEYERTDQRRGYRNGSYPRQLNTRVGTIYLNVCRDRNGQFQTSLFNRYQRSEKALLLAMSEMYLQGVSTRKVSSIVEELCGQTVSKSLVSKLSCGFDGDLQKWRERPLSRDYPYLLFDARYEKVRENGRVVSKAVVVAIGITDDGIREVIGCWVINSESFEAWDSCFNRLKERGLNGVRYVVSDDNKGLRKALMKYFQGVVLQRCQVHFMRNFMNKLSKKDRSEGIQLLQEVFAAHSKERAMSTMSHLVEFLLSRKKDAIAEWIEENIEDTLLVLNLPTEHRKMMRSTNMIERLNQELKRRSKVVRIFPNDKSCLRLMTALCQESSEAWGSRKYLDMNV